MDPQLGVGGTTPKPIKERKASVKVTDGIEKLKLTSTSESTFGAKCLNKM